MTRQSTFLWPFPGGLPGGKDWEFLRRILGDLSKKLTWPLVQLAFTGPAGLNITAINFSVDSDPSLLYRTATDRIYAPQDYNQYIAIGTCGAIWTTTGTNRTNLIWNRNGVATVWGESRYSDAATVRATAKLFEPMTKGEYLTVSTASSGAGTELENAKALVVFLPVA